MSKILINEPHHDVRALLVQMATRLGYQPLAVHEVQGAMPSDASVLLFEPAETECLRHAQALRGERPDLRFVCVSIEPPEPSWLELDPAAYVMKPFSLASLRTALAAASA